MPLWRPYLRYLTSGIADLANGSSSTMAGSVTAALFLERFVADGQRWAHLDVYAWNDSDRPGRPAGGEAMALRAAYAMLKARGIAPWLFPSSLAGEGGAKRRERGRGSRGID